ncbi:hypothetical protein [Affinirhizobium pseudoryzae]|uniref:hypothetical protein n=1 Tax=Allorhizobium pseudoryzae TaxID=379684 RepID=UPI0013EA2DF9|nr:hypothetical protein [Allorhizobium pseudoryzae]
MPKPRLRTPLAKLRKHWKRASPEERHAFLEHIGARQATRPPESQEPTESGLSHLIANGRYLLPQTVVRIEAIMRARRIGPAEVVAELGFPDQGVALARALTQQSSLRLTVIAALSAWLKAREESPTS